MYCQKTRDNNVVTRNTKLHHLKIFFNYLQHEEIITEKENPIHKMKLAKEEVKIEVFQDEHIKQMLRYYRRLKARNKSFYAYRDHTFRNWLKARRAYQYTLERIGLGKPNSNPIR